MLPESQGPPGQDRGPFRAAPTAAERRLVLVWPLAVAAVVALKPLWLVLAPLLPACSLRATTGIPCPTCGTTRAAIALLDGRLGDALAVNPLMTVAALALAAASAFAPLWVLSGRALPRPGNPPRWLWLALAGALLANWAYLIATR
jgi:hypothetical protein